MARRKKLNWYCRHCSKHQNVKAHLEDRPSCGGCGRTMETDDFICDSPSEVRAVLTKATGAAESQAPQFDARYIARMIDHEKRLQDLERRAQASRTVFEDLDAAIPQMNPAQLAGLVALLDHHVEHMTRAAASARRMLKSPRGDGGN